MAVWLAACPHPTHEPFVAGATEGTRGARRATRRFQPLTAASAVSNEALPRGALAAGARSPAEGHRPPPHVVVAGAAALL